MAPIDDAFLKLYGHNQGEKEQITSLRDGARSSRGGQPPECAFASSGSEGSLFQCRQTSPSPEISRELSLEVLGDHPEDPLIPKPGFPADLGDVVNPLVTWANPSYGSDHVYTFLLNSFGPGTASEELRGGAFGASALAQGILIQGSSPAADPGEMPSEQPEEKRRVDTDPGFSPVRPPHFRKQKEASGVSRGDKWEGTPLAASCGGPTCWISSRTELELAPQERTPGQAREGENPRGTPKLSNVAGPAVQGAEEIALPREGEGQKAELGGPPKGTEPQRSSTSAKSPSISKPHWGPSPCEKPHRRSEESCTGQCSKGGGEGSLAVSCNANTGPHFSRSCGVAAVVGAESPVGSSHRLRATATSEEDQMSVAPHPVGPDLEGTLPEGGESLGETSSNPRAIWEAPLRSSRDKGGSFGRVETEAPESRTARKLTPAYSVEDIIWPSAVIRLSLAAQGALEVIEKQIFARLGKGYRAFGFAAAAPGQGTTTLLLAMARYLLSQGRKVGLVDAAFHHPVLCHRLGVLPEVGWEQMSTRKLPPGEVTIRVEEQPLLLVPWMGSSENGLSSCEGTLLPAINSDEITGLLQSLSEETDVILVDLGVLERTEQKARDPRWLILPILGGVVTVWDVRRPNPTEREALEKEILAMGGFLLGEAENFTVLQRCA